MGSGMKKKLVANLLAKIKKAVPAMSTRMKGGFLTTLLTTLLPTIGTMIIPQILS